MSLIQPIPTKRWLVNPAPRRRGLISLTPLIDVVFILLVFFMLASSFLDWHAIDLSAPGKTATTSTSSNKPVLIEIQEHGLRFAGTVLSVDEIRTKVRITVTEKPNQVFFVRPEEGISLQQTLHVLDMMESSGASKVSLIRGNTEMRP